ncbi:MAG TPA: nuclear transport factor 2 family protein [Mucilaginibacter sp.]
MKTLKSIMLGMSLLLVFSAANATETPAVALTKNYTINTYIDAMTHGKLNGINNVLDQNAKFSILRGKKVVSYGKQEVIDHLQINKDVEMDCTTNTSIVESNADYTLVKVDMNYHNSIQSNYVTIINTGEGWKITNVYSVFK